uniref:Unkown protein n=1 Tax=Riptortus pedestris TaxID=329032 RepID=R4WRE7_RIPPE|nr:unkown protein [Riptortus pedestris]
MKLVLLSLALLGSVLAEEAPFKPQGALLVLPQQFNAAAQQQEAETIDKISERVMERLRQEQGSQTGNYHVYLADGRLQKVQFTAAPLRAQPNQNTQQVSLQNSQTSIGSNTYQFNQQNAQANNRFQAYTQAQQYKQSEEQSQYNPSYTTNSYSRVSLQGSATQASEGQVSEPNPVVAHFGRLQQERLQQQLKQLQEQQEQLKQQAEEVQQQLQQQQEFASNFVATVQYSEVPPIPAPIYSQNPAPVTRILRYAPQYF